MRKTSYRLNVFLILFLFSVFIFSCSKEIITDDGDKNPVSNTESASQLKAVSVDLPGRNLASNCFQCHGTNGYAGELKIAGQSSSGIVSKLNDMKTRDPKDNIMNVHARAYSAEEIKLIGDFFSKQ
jgi:cytochrome subunit of sulfide dehydrogenase